MDANNSFQHTDQGTVCMTDSALTVIDQARFLNQLSSQTPCHFYISVYNSDPFLHFWKKEISNLENVSSLRI